MSRRTTKQRRAARRRNQRPLTATEARDLLRQGLDRSRPLFEALQEHFQRNVLNPLIEDVCRRLSDRHPLLLEADFSK
jgi:hypothetical protein